VIGRHTGLWWSAVQMVGASVTTLSLVALSLCLAGILLALIWRA